MENIGLRMLGYCLKPNGILHHKNARAPAKMIDATYQQNQGHTQVDHLGNKQKYYI